MIGITKPSANLGAITDLINLKTEKLTSKDVVILCGGTRDIAKNEASTGLRHISQFVKCTENTNVIVTSAPTRYDLHPSSCVNKEVESFNRKLQKSMKIHNHIRVCSMSTNCDHFTTHGLHMNTRGINWITHTWASLIKTLTSSSLLTSIPLPEKNKCNENPVFPAINNCVNNMRECVDERTVLQDDHCNAMSPISLQWKEDSPVSSNKVQPTPQTQPPHSPKESSTNEKKSNRTKKSPPYQE